MADIISGKDRFEGKKSDTPKESVSAKDSYRKELSEETRDKIFWHRVKRALIAVGICCLIAVIICVVSVISKVRTYHSYSVAASYNRDDTGTAQYIEFGSGYVRYSNDGITYIDTKNNSVWNETYSMQKPQVKQCDDCLAVADINGSQIFIFNTEGKLGSVDTSLSISQIEVSKQGAVAAVLEDNTANYINLYKTDGSKVYSVKTTLAGDGYPLDISISNDATKLIASYLYVSGEEIKTNVVFYNFSEVGQNVTERVVGGFNHYDSTIVGDVEFINDETAVAVGEDVISIYKIKEYPKLQQEVEIDGEIKQVFFGKKQIGLVLANGDSGDLYRLVVYNLSGSKKFETTFNTQYDRISFDSESIVMNNTTTLSVMNLDGKILTTQTMDLPIQSILRTGSRGKYILINSKYIQNIHLN